MPFASIYRLAVLVSVDGPWTTSFFCWWAVRMAWRRSARFLVANASGRHCVVTGAYTLQPCSNSRRGKARACAPPGVLARRVYNQRRSRWCVRHGWKQRGLSLKITAQPVCATPAWTFWPPAMVTYIARKTVAESLGSSAVTPPTACAVAGNYTKTLPQQCLINLSPWQDSADRRLAPPSITIFATLFF
jgi:hypothetical protein